MIGSVKIANTHAITRFEERLGVIISNKNGVNITLSNKNSVRVQEYFHYDTNNRCADYVLYFRGNMIVLAVDEDNKQAISVMTSGKKVDICLEKARKILTKRT